MWRNRRYAVTTVGILVVLFSANRQVSTCAEQQTSQTVAVIGGTSITAQELDNRASGRLFSLRTQEFEVRNATLQEMINAVLLSNEAKRRGVTVENLVGTEVDGRTNPPTSGEIRAVYDAQSERYAKTSRADAEKEIGAAVWRSRLQRRRNEFLHELRARERVVVLLEPPRIAVTTDNEPAIGRNDAQVTIVAFSDFECQYCASVVRTIKQLLAHYGDQIRYVFRDFPLPIHPYATSAAEAAACAAEQNRFWEYHDLLFADQAHLDEPSLERRASELKLDGTRFSECMASSRHTPDWRKDKADGEHYGIVGTPAFFINGRLLTGAAPYDAFSKIIDEELSRTRPNQSTKQ